jgi:hypothetical protein
MIDLFDFLTTNWRWLVAAVIVTIYVFKGVVIVKQ